MRNHNQEQGDLPPDQWQQILNSVPQKTPGPYAQKASRKQREFLWELGLRDTDLIDSLDKDQASDYITAALHARDRSSRKKKRGCIKTLFWLVVCGAVLLVGMSMCSAIFQPPRHQEEPQHEEPAVKEAQESEDSL